MILSQSYVELDPAVNVLADPSRARPRVVRAISGYRQSPIDALSRESAAGSLDMRYLPA